MRTHSSNHKGWMMNRYAVLSIIAVLAVLPLSAQNSAGDEATIEPRQVIDAPTAGLLKRGSFGMDVDFFQEGGVGIALSAGALERLNFGLSFGGTQILGHEKVTMQKLPGINIKYRFIDESVMMPAIAIGFDTQGKESYIDSTERFTIKSRGLFVAASKNYKLFGNLSLHGGINRSMESKDGDKDLDVFVGAEKSFGPDISFLCEYDFGFNDNGPASLGQGRGYLNTGARWSFGNGFTLGFDLKNLVKNQERVTVGNRLIKIEYVRTL